MKKKNLKIQLLNGILDDKKSDDLFMYTEFPIVKDEPNLNQYHFTETFIDSVVDNEDKYIGSPLVVDTNSLLSSDFENLGHKYSKFTGTFATSEIGSFYKFEKRFDENGIAELIGYAKISKRNYDLCEAIVELFNSDIGLNISVEVVASEYKVDGNTLIIGASDKNFMSGVAIVSFPANPLSKVLTLVAQYLDKGNDNMKNEDKKNIFAELNHDDIRCQLSKLVNNEKDEYGYTKWNYWISAVYNDYVVYCDYKTSGVYFKIGYIVASDNVVSLTGVPEKVEISYTILNNEGGNKMENVDINKIIDDNKALLLENENLKKLVEVLNTEKETLISEKATIESVKETLVSEKSEIEVKLNEANEVVVSLGKEKETLTAQIETFTAEQNERVEKETVAKIDTLISEVKDELSEEEMTLVNEVAESKDVSKVEFKINEVLASKYKTELKLTNSKNENFFVVAPTKTVGNADDLSKFNM